MDEFVFYRENKGLCWTLSQLRVVSHRRSENQLSVPTADASTLKTYLESLLPPDINHNHGGTAPDLATVLHRLKMHFSEHCRLLIPRRRTGQSTVSASQGGCPQLRMHPG